MIWQRDGGELRIHEEVAAALARLALDNCAGIAPSARRGSPLVRPHGIVVRSQDGLVVDCHVELATGWDARQAEVAQRAEQAVGDMLARWLGMSPRRVTVHVRGAGSKTRKSHPSQQVPAS